MPNTITDGSQTGLRAALWIVLLAGSSLVFSTAFACATPFVALATIAGTQLARREAMLAVTLAWLGNQAIGYLALGYPQTWDSFAWGGAIGIAALLATGVAGIVGRMGERGLVAIGAAFFAAFSVYEIALLAATVALPTEEAAFAPATVARIFAIDATACAVLFALQMAARAFGLIAPAGRPAQAAEAH